MTLKFKEAAVAVAAISITGVDVKAPSELVQVPGSRGLPIMQPGPRFIRNLRPVIDSQGGGGVRQRTVTYDQVWRVLQSQAGTNRNLAEAYDDLLELFATIENALEGNDTLYDGDDNLVATDCRLTAVSDFNQVQAPDDTVYFGFDVTIQITELVN